MKLTPEQITLHKAAVASITASIGWKLISKMAEETIISFEREALLCTDESKIIGLQRKAQAANQFWDLLCGEIKALSSVDSSNTDFVSVTTE